MPAASIAQRRMFAIAEHHPGELYARNRGLAKLGKKTLHEFAATSERGLPERRKAKAKLPSAASGRKGAGGY